MISKFIFKTLLGLGRNVFSIIVAMITGHCVITQLPLTTSVDEEGTIIHFLCQCSSLARFRFRLIGSTILISLMELSPIDSKDINSFLNFKAFFQRGVAVLLMCSSCVTVQRLRPPVASQRTAMRAQVIVLYNSYHFNLPILSVRQFCNYHLLLTSNRMNSVADVLTLLQ